MPNPEGSIARLHKSKREGVIPPSELTDGDKSLFATDSLRHRGRRRLVMERGDEKSSVLDSTPHDGLAVARFGSLACPLMPRSLV